MTTSGADGVVHLAARDIPVPAHLSPEARAVLAMRFPKPSPPPLDDKDAWRAYIAAADAGIAPIMRQMSAGLTVQVEERDVGGARIYDVVPSARDGGDREIILDLHGGALIFGGGELCRIAGMIAASRFGRRVWSVDYRMPPDHPFPAALEDCVAAYRAVLRERLPTEIVVCGSSAGGNLAAALVLRARDEGLPLPAGLILRTPEVDLTESGDSFQTNDGLDPGLSSTMQINLLYADGQDLRQPYLSPLFADFAPGFPPTLLTTGTRDLFLSNTVRMHRVLRAAGISAELHVVEAGPHTGFPGSPEGGEIESELRAFVKRVMAGG